MSWRHEVTLLACLQQDSKLSVAPLYTWACKHQDCTQYMFRYMCPDGFSCHVGARVQIEELRTAESSHYLLAGPAYNRIMNHCVLETHGANMSRCTCLRVWWDMGDLDECPAEVEGVHYADAIHYVNVNHCNKRHPGTPCVAWNEDWGDLPPIMYENGGIYSVDVLRSAMPKPPGADTPTSSGSISSSGTDNEEETSTAPGWQPVPYRLVPPVFGVQQQQHILPAVVESGV